MEQLKGSFYLFCAFLLAGTSVVCARFVSGRLGTFTIASASLFFAILGLLSVYGLKTLKEIRRLKAGDWFMILLQAFFGIFLFRVFLLQGLLYTSSAEAGILTGVTPAVTVILASLALKEAVNRQNTVGIVSTVAGILLVQGILSPGNVFSLEHISGNALVVCAAVSEALFNVLSRIAGLKPAAHRGQPLNPVIQTTLVAFVAFFLCLVPSLLENPIPSLAALSPGQWLALVWYGLIVTALAFISWYSGIKRCTACAAAAFSGMMPFTSLILSTALLKENIGWAQWSGGALIILGMLLIGMRQTDRTTPGKTGYVEGSTCPQS